MIGMKYKDFKKLLDKVVKSYDVSDATEVFIDVHETLVFCVGKGIQVGIDLNRDRDIYVREGG